MAKPPPADAGLYCPLWKKDVSKVCHTCPWYIQLRGTNKNTGEDIDNWGCAVGFLPVLLLENAAMSNRTGAAVESFRNEMVKSTDDMAKSVVQAVAIASDQRDGRLIDARNNRG
jgi:hypothetical protein